MTNNQSPRWSLLPSYISWLTIVLALLAIGTFVAISQPAMQQYPTPVGIQGGGVGYSGTSQAMPPTAAGTPMMTPNVDYPPYPYPNPDVPATDTREFLKIYYNASMSTRDVPGLTSRVDTVVHKYNGRIDQESSSAQYGSVSFVVSQSKYDAFRAELEALVPSRFLTVNISSQNLLSQKLSIEDQQKQADTTLADYKTARQNIVTTHTSTVQSLQSKIDAAAGQLAILQAEPSTPEVQAQIQTVSDDWNSLKQQLADENASYTTQLSDADANIKYAQDVQTAVQTQNQTLLDNVATVTGTVSIQWISLWDIALLYLPGYWIPIIFGILTCLSFLRDRRRISQSTTL